MVKFSTNLILKKISKDNFEKKKKIILGKKNKSKKKKNTAATVNIPRFRVFYNI